MVSTMTAPARSTILAWTSLVTTSRVLLDEIESALKAEGFPALGWYDALLEIEKAGDTGIRPFELKDRLLLPQYSVSRLVERLVAAGYVERRDVEADGRGQVVALTAEGLSLRKAMWPVYAGVLTRSVEQRLSRDEARDLAELLGKLR